MGAEQFHDSSPEARKTTPESAVEHLEQVERIGKDLERAAENSVENGEKSEAKARHEALNEAVSVERGSAEKKKGEPASPARRRHGVVSKQEKKANYKKTMKRVQSEMPAAQRAFSKFIHNPAVEKTSEALGNTVARPNAILSGAIVAFVLVLGVYLVAKHYGYQLSGFETIGAFIAGWLIGILYDFFKVMITGKR